MYNGCVSVMAPAYTFLVSVRSASTSEFPAWSRAGKAAPNFSLKEAISGLNSGCAVAISVAVCCIGPAKLVPNPESAAFWSLFNNENSF